MTGWQSGHSWAEIGLRLGITRHHTLARYQTPARDQTPAYPNLTRSALGDPAMWQDDHHDRDRGRSR